MGRSRRSSDDGLGVLERRFGEALRAGDGLSAERVIDDALQDGLAPADIQSLVIGPAMVGIGDLWESGHLGVADEHLATSISQRSLVPLYEALTTQRGDIGVRRTVLLAGPEGQHHVLGLRMVADVLEGAGFNVLHLGGDVPSSSLRDFAAEHVPAVVGLSFGVSSESNLARLVDAIWVVNEVAPEARIMLGGRAVPTFLKEAGFPCPGSSMEVLETVQALLAAPPQGLSDVVARLHEEGGERVWMDDPDGDADPLAKRLAEAADNAVDLARRHVRRAEAYREMALIDPLTKLPNRRAFEDELTARAERPGTAGMVLMVDVDSFKGVNDGHGHDAGDRLLREIGKSIGDAVREGDLAARVGGDEFAAILPGASAAVASQIGDRIRAAVARIAEPTATVSIGLAPLNDDSRAALLAADMALYQAKAAGRDRVAIHD